MGLSIKIQSKSNYYDYQQGYKDHTRNNDCSEYLLQSKKMRRKTIKGLK